MVVRLLVAAGLSAVMSCAWATGPTLPGNLQKTALDEVQRLSIPAADVRAAVDDDGKAQGRPMRIGIVQRLDRILLDDGVAHLGQWHDTGDGRALWALDIASEGAVSLDLQFSRFVLPEGAQLYLANAAGDYVLGPVSGSDALADGRYYSALVPGDSLRVEVLADPAQRDGIRLHLEGVSYGYRGLFDLPDHPDAMRSGACNIDVTCPLGDGWGDQIDAVGQYIFSSGGGSYVCTGSLVANTAGTPVPYFLTAAHCVANQSEAQSMRVYWNYQSPTCRTPGSGASGSSLPRPSTYNNGATLRMAFSGSDNSLVELNAPVPLSEDPFFAGWDRRDLATPGNPQVSGAVSIHHPAGHEKRISKDEDLLSVTNYLGSSTNANGSHYRIGQWEHGTTEGGSSGSALFTPDGHVIGTLHGGYASCTSLSGDWYGRIHRGWAGAGTDSSRLSTWLDPQGTGAQVLDGYRTVTLDEADLAIALNANPNPVDIGQQLSIGVNVGNLGPGAASQVALTVSLPTGLAYAGSSSGGWSCSATGVNVSCTHADDVANGTKASSLQVVADVVALETGPVTLAAEVSAANPDPVGGNNSASIQIQISGEPPRPDAIYCDGFEAGGDGACAPPVDPDIVDSGQVNIVVPASIDLTGFSINWVTGATCDCDDESDYHFNPYAQGDNLLSFWFYPNDSTGGRAGMVRNQKYAVLASGATVGPQADFAAIGGDSMPGYMADWRAGATGHLGFRFTHPVTGQTTYGHALLQTGANGGFPMTIVRYWYNAAGNAITIP